MTIGSDVSDWVGFMDWGAGIALDRLRNVLQHFEFLFPFADTWAFEIRSHAGNTPFLGIRLNTRDSESTPGNAVQVLIDHQMPIPYRMDWTQEDWERWLLEMIFLVIRHEACEHFTVDGVKVFYPEHGERSNPYKIVRHDRQPTM